MLREIASLTVHTVHYSKNKLQEQYVSIQMQDLFLFLPTSNLVMMHGPYFQVENETNYGQNIPM